MLNILNIILMLVTLGVPFIALTCQSRRLCPAVVSLLSCGLFLLLCLLSAIQYGFLIGTAKAYVAFGGFVELTAVIVTAVLYGLHLFTGKAETLLCRSNLILLAMQAIPLLLSIPFRFYFCTAYHTLCILLGVYLLFSQKNREDE